MRYLVALFAIAASCLIAQSPSFYRINHTYELGGEGSWDCADQYRVVQTLETPQRSRNMGLDPKNHRIYVPAANFGEVPAGGRGGRPPVLPGSFRLLVIERAPAVH